VAWTRAAQLRCSLEAIERIADGAHAQVFARMRPQTLAAIRSASWLDWLPLEFDIELAEAVAKVLGPTRDRERARQSVLLSFQSPLLHPFVTGVEKVFGFHVGPLLRQSTRAFQHVFREAGWLTLVIGHGNERVLVWSEVPALVFEHRLYFDAIAGAFEALYVLCRVDGKVAVEAIDLARHRAELRFSWY
jgi:hypothetical protein